MVEKVWQGCVMLQATSLSELENILANKLLPDLPTETHLYNVNREFNNNRIDYLLNSIYEGPDQQKTKEFISRIRMELIRQNYYAHPEQQEYLHNLLYKLQNAIIFLRNNIELFEFVSLNILAIGILVRLRKLTPIQALFLQHCSKGFTFADTLIAIMPIIELAPNREEFLIDITNALITSLSLNPINKKEFANIKWNWYTFEKILNTEEKLRVLEILKDKLLSHPVNNHNTVLALEGYCHNQNLLKTLDSYTIHTLLNTAIFLPRITSSRHIITLIAAEYKEVFNHTNYIRFLLDNLNNIMTRRNSILFFETISKDITYLLNKKELAELGTKLFLLLKNPKTFQHELKIITKIIKTIANKDYHTHIKLADFVNTIIDNPSYHHITVLSLFPNIIEQYQVRGCLNKLHAIIYPRTWLDRFRFAFSNNSFKKIAIEALIAIVKSDLVIPQYWEHNPVENIIQSYCEQNLSLKHHIGEALEFFAKKYPYFFTTNACDFLVNHATNFQTFVMPALAILVTKRHHIIQNNITAELLMKLLKAFSIIGSFFYNQYKIEAPIYAILESHPQIITKDHVEFLIGKINNTSNKILNFIFIIIEQKPELFSERDLAQIEEGLNNCLHDSLPLKEYRNTFELFIENRIFPKERIASFLVFHLRNSEALHPNAQLLVLSTLCKLLCMYKKDFALVQELLPYIIAKISDSQPRIRTAAFLGILNFCDNEITKTSLLTLQNEYTNFLLTEHDFAERFDAIGYDVLQKTLAINNHFFRDNGEVYNIYPAFNNSNNLKEDHLPLRSHSIFYDNRLQNENQIEAEIESKLEQESLTAKIA